MTSVVKIVLAGILLSVTAAAQTPEKTPPSARVKTAGRIPVSSPLWQAVITDSLNKRVTGIWQKPLQWPSVDHLPGLHELQEPVRQQFYQYIGSTAGANKLHQLQKGLGVLHNPGRAQQYVSEKLRGFYAMRNDNGIFSLLQAGAYRNNFKGATATAFYDNAPGSQSLTGFNIQLEDQVMLNNIPVNIVYSNISGQSNIANSLSDQSLLKASFDKDAYMKRLTGIVEKKYDLKKYFLQDIDMKSAVKDFTAKQLTGIHEQIQQQLNPRQLSAFRDLLSPDHIIQLDTVQIRNMLLHNNTLRLSEKDLDLASALAEDSILASATVTGTDTLTLQHMRVASAARSYLKSICQLRKNVVEGLEAKAVISGQHAATSKINDIMDGEENKKRQIKELLPLNFLQKLLLSAKQMDIGNIAANGSKGGVQDLFMSGIQASFLSKDKFLMLGAGKRIDGGMIRDRNFISAVDPGIFSMQFLQMGKGDIDAAHSHVMLVNANSKTGSRGPYSTMTLPRNTFVGAFSEEISAGKYGSIAARFSKSSNQFSHAATGNEAALASKAAASALFNDFWQTVSVGLDYTGQVEEWRVTHRAYISYSGLGYNNPASPGAGRGTVRYGLKLKRSWNKNKMSIGFRSDFQDISASALTGSKWKNRQFALDGRVKINRQLSIDAHLNQASMKNISDKQVPTTFITRQVSLGSQLNGRIAAWPYNSNIIFGLQQLDMKPVQSMLLNLNVSHHVIIQTHVLSFNLFYNKDVRHQAIYADLFTAESSWSYLLMKKISCSSGITYLDNKAVVQQIGFKQTASTAVGPRLNVNMYIDCRKHLLNTPQNYLFGNFRSELSLSYLLN